VPPADAGGTVREQLLEALRAGPATVKDLSRTVGVSERDVVRHLEHVERSLRGRGGRLRVALPACLDCGFGFAKRERLARPGHCPRCKGTRISLPSFSVEEGRPR
jgi:predicted Zn-ribbon and HTH transcriptional regulator